MAAVLGEADVLVVSRFEDEAHGSGPSPGRPRADLRPLEGQRVHEVTSVGAHSSNLLAQLLAEQAVRLDHEHQQHHDVRRGVLEAVGQVEARERLDDADHQPADDRARQAAEAAHHRRRKGLEPDEAHVRVHEVGRELVLRRGLHRDAQLAVAEHREQQAAQDGGGHDDHELLQVHHQLAQLPDLVLVGTASVCVSVPMPGTMVTSPRHVRDADGQHHDRELRLPEDRPDHHQLQQHAEGRHRHHREDGRQPEGHAKSDMPANAPKAPSIIRSPCAKLTVSVAL
ncbi:hypothetical protein DdX_21546 [Ditylenchus destructor]|uniref:Uncharacterized protein n=1 Tax=Ditylenchus destructor TaxID=166010 RepID=A0AAD4QVG6_9BILA|nr:hypothetical protein DdX_21546 [Ditylenchus destructor]